MTLRKHSITIGDNANAMITIQLAQTAAMMTLSKVKREDRTNKK